jgi:hypothetical protein
MVRIGEWRGTGAATSECNIALERRIVPEVIRDIDPGGREPVRGMLHLTCSGSARWGFQAAPVRRPARPMVPAVLNRGEPDTGEDLILDERPTRGYVPL